VIRPWELEASLLQHLWLKGEKEGEILIEVIA